VLTAPRRWRPARHPAQPSRRSGRTRRSLLPCGHFRYGPPRVAARWVSRAERCGTPAKCPEAGTDAPDAGPDCAANARRSGQSPALPLPDLDLTGQPAAYGHEGCGHSPAGAGSTCRGYAERHQRLRSPGAGSRRFDLIAADRSHRSHPASAVGAGRRPARRRAGLQRGPRPRMWAPPSPRTSRSPFRATPPPPVTEAGGLGRTGELWGRSSHLCSSSPSFSGTAVACSARGHPRSDRTLCPRC
jgi:hypothetical protein